MTRSTFFWRWWLILRIILVVPTRKATGAKLGRFPRFRPNFTQNSRRWRWWGVSRIFGRFWGGVIGTPVFFCFNHSSRNAARLLCIRCASTAHPLRIQPFRGVKTTLLLYRSFHPSVYGKIYSVSSSSSSSSSLFVCRPYLLSSHVSTLVHLISTFYCTSQSVGMAEWLDGHLGSSRSWVETLLE